MPCLEGSLRRTLRIGDDAGGARWRLAEVQLSTTNLNGSARCTIPKAGVLKVLIHLHSREHSRTPGGQFRKSQRNDKVRDVELRGSELSRLVKSQDHAVAACSRYREIHVSIESPEFWIVRHSYLVYRADV
jgi:hypothetical protein